MTEDTFGFDAAGVSDIQTMAGLLLGRRVDHSAHAQPRTGGLNAVILQPVDALATQAWNTAQLDAELWTIDGGDWSNLRQPQTIRHVSNGRQIAIPVGHAGLCVQDAAFWAVNIGTLDAATHPLTGHSTGVAAVLDPDADGDLVITDARLDFIRRDSQGEIPDGTLIQLAWISGSLTIVWADCEPHDDLTGLEAEP
jgi:hypothetical protein